MMRIVCDQRKKPMALHDKVDKTGAQDTNLSTVEYRMSQKNILLIRSHSTYLRKQDL